MARLQVRLEVSFPKGSWADEITKDLAQRATDAMAAAVEGFKGDVRRAIQSAGLGRRLGFAIRSELYPQGRVSMSPAGVIRARGQSAEKVIESYSEGAVIRPRNGSSWLAIPVRENLPYLGRGVKPTPDLVEKRLGRPLRWVAPKNGRGRFGLLVADAVTRGKTGKRVTGYGRDRSRKERRSGKAETLVMFVLVPQVTVRKRLDFGAIGDKWANQLPRLMASSRRS